MHWFTLPLIKYWYFLGWRSVIEIFFCAALFYHFSQWLKRDRHHNLLPGFYAYCITALLSYALKLTLITYLMVFFAPVVLMLFIIVHHDLLQKNFVIARTITPAKKTEHDWLTTLMSCLMAAAHRNKAITCIIERHDSLVAVVSSPLTFNTDVHKDLLDILMTSPSFNAKAMLWLNHHGTLLGINASLHTPIDDVWLDASVNQLEPWKQQALLLTTKTDAVILHIDETRTCTIIAQNNVMDGIAPAQAVQTIKQILYGKKESFLATRGTHEAFVEKPTHQQPSA